MGFPGSSAGEESACKAGDPSLIPGSGRAPGEGIGYPLQYSWASLGGSEGKDSACNTGDLASISGLRRSPGGGNPIQYFFLENPHRQRSRKESAMTEQLSTAQHSTVRKVILISIIILIIMCKIDCMG